MHNGTIHVSKQQKTQTLTFQLHSFLKLKTNPTKRPFHENPVSHYRHMGIQKSLHLWQNRGHLIPTLETYEMADWMSKKKKGLQYQSSSSGVDYE